MRYVLLLLLLIRPLCAFEEPELSTKSVGHISLPPEISPLTHATHSFFPKVNPISGEYVEEECDFEVAGCEPLSLRRFYGHMCSSDRRYGIGWRVNPEAFFMANLQYQKQQIFAAPGDENGSVLYMDHNEGGTYTLSKNSAYAYTNLDGLDPHNTIVNFWVERGNEKKFRYVGYVQDGSGRERHFSSPWHTWNKDISFHLDPRQFKGWFSPEAWIPYQLLFGEERLPNGNILVYDYQKWQDELHFPSPKLLKSIVAYNHDKTKILGKLTFDYGKYNWRHKQVVDRVSQRDVILDRTFWEVGSYTAYGNDQKLACFYHSHVNKGTSPCLLTQINAFDGQTSYSYNSNGYLNKTDRGDGRIFQTEFDGSGKVSHQKGPYGTIGRYIYHKGATEIFDAENNRTLFRYDDKKRVTSIEKPDLVERFTWDENNRLQAKTLEDPNGAVYIQQLYKYDERGNRLEETLVGEEERYTITRTFSNDRFNLKLSETDNSGKITYYTYYPDTNLVETESVYDGNQFLYSTSYLYDDCAVCIKKTVEGEDYNRTTLTKPKQSLPCFGLPETIEERAGEALLSKTVYTYHPSGKIASEARYDASGKHCYTLHNTYDERNRLISSTDPFGHTTTYAYDNQNNLIRQKGLHETTWEYDLENRPTVERTAGIEKRWTYDRLGRVAAYTDPCGQTTRYTYDYAGRPTRIEHPDGGVEQKTYDLLGNPIQEIDQNGHVTLKNYNCRSQVTYILHPDGTEEYFRYDLSGNLTSYKDKNGTTTTYTYDVLGRPIKEEALDTVKTLTYSPFSLLSETDELGVTTYYTYDTAGRKIGENKGRLEISYAYDPLGRLTRIEKPFTVTIQEYDCLDRLIEQRTEDKQGNLILQESYRYDADGNKTHTTTCAGTTKTLYNAQKLPIQITDPQGTITTIAYTYSNNFIKTTIDPDGVTHVETHDPCGRLQSLQTCNPDTIQHREFAYDLAGNRTQEIEYIYEGTTPTAQRINRWEYGPCNRLEKLIESDLKETCYFYDDKGRLQTILKPDQTELHHTYDSFGRLKNLSSRDIDYTYSYDKKGRITAVSDGTQRFYDAFDNIIEERLANGYTLKYIYNAEGKLINLQLPDGTSAAFTYQGNQLSKVSYKGQTISYQRNLHGKPIRITLPIGTIQLSYDASLRLKSTISPYYTAVDYQYDSTGCLTHYTYTDPLGPVTMDFTYDPLRQLTSERGHTYAYDSLNNRIYKDTLRQTLNTLSQVTNDGETTYIYNTNGNLIQAGERHFGYDALDRLIRVDNYTYTYDAFNRRLTKITPSETIRYIWQLKNEIGSSNGELRILGEGLGAEIGAAVLIQLGDQLYFPFHDQRGALTTLVDLKGNPAETIRYTAFGEELTDTMLNPWRFCSKRLDPETGFIYFGRRYYAPELGRWITPDPRGFLDGPNLYAYVANTPLLTIDFYGEWGWPRWASAAFEFACPITSAAYRLPADTPLWKRGAYAIGGGLEMATLVGTVPLRGAAMLTQKTVYQIGRSALSRTAGKESYRASAKAATIAERKLLDQTASNATTRRVETAFVKESVTFDLDALSQAASVSDRGKFTLAGRSLTKHGAGARPTNSLFPAPKGNPSTINKQAQNIVDDILTTPGGTLQNSYRGRFGNTLEVSAPDGRGIVYDFEGQFLFFKE